MNLHHSKPTVVIGAGIIGAAIAHEMQRRGEKTILIDRNEPGTGASFGNMASIAINGFDAISRPSTWKKIPFWLVNPEAPVCADPLYVPKMLPWALRFLLAGTHKRIEEIEDAGASLATRAHQDLAAMLDRLNASDMLSQKTCLCLFGSEDEFAAGKANLDMMTRYGLEFEILSGRAIQAHEPLLNTAISKAALLPGNHFISNPYQLVLRLVEDFLALGGELRKTEITGMEPDGNRVTGLRLADGGRIEAEKIVVAAGVGSRFLAADIGEMLPLETERGYHTQIMEPGIELQWSIIWPDRAFMITPTAGGIRVGGSVEMAGLEKAPNYRRAKILVEHAKYALPGLQTGQASEWMGHRPALPDTIPVISASEKYSGLFYATGHGHLGLTFAATTARLLADMMTGLKPPVAMQPFDIGRF